MPALALIAALSFFAGPARAGEVVFSHRAPEHAPAYRNLLIQGLVAGLDDGESVSVYHRPLDQGDFDVFEARVRGAVLDTYIHGDYVLAPGVEYYLAVTDSEGQLHTHPEGAPEAPAFRVFVDSEDDPRGDRLGSPPRIEIVAPENRAGLELGDLVVVAAFHDLDGDLAASGIRLIVDGRDLSREAQISSELLVWIPGADLPPGPLRIEVEAQDTAGNRASTQTLNLDLLRPGMAGRAPGFFDRVPSPSGRLVLDSRFTSLDGAGAENRQEPSRTLRGRLDARGSLGVVDYRARTFVTSDESSDLQPRNRYRLDMTSGPLRLSAGDVTPRLGPLSIWGKRMRGVELELESGVFDAQILYGSILRSVEGEGHDSLIVGPPDELRPVVESAGTYRRQLKALRLGSVTGRALGMTLSFLKVKDDLESIRYGHKPKDNVVFGADLKLDTFNHRFRLDAAAAMSFLTEDISEGSLTREEADSTLGIRLPFDPQSFESLLIINASTTPLDMTGLTNLALHATARGNIAGNLMELRFRRVGPVYTSLAATSLPQDHQGMRLRDSFGLANRRVRVTGEFERYRDNLAGDKKFTRHTDVVAGNLSYTPRRGVFSGLGAGFRMQSQSNGDASESEGVDNRTLLFTLRGGAHFPVRDFSQNLRLSMFLTDRADFISEAGESRGMNMVLESRTGMPEMPLALDFLLGLSSNSYPGLENEDGGMGIEADFTTLQFGLDYERERTPMRLTWRRVSGGGDMMGANSARSSADLSLDYRFRAGPILTGRAGWVQFNDRSIGDEDYDETFLGIGIEQPF